MNHTTIPSISLKFTDPQATRPLVSNVRVNEQADGTFSLEIDLPASCSKVDEVFFLEPDGMPPDSKTVLNVAPGTAHSLSAKQFVVVFSKPSVPEAPLLAKSAVKKTAKKAAPKGKRK